ncbi:tRNA pseudouridine(55) synthase TruB [Candidatus Clavichlamydia salmonicola]|uniref:tRNA pseudouridine(55) synthase TruB n=1 Tax=Candidatus Clavichlamydia salmonicola TaxID=469812 RepID=UPI00189185AA|nr:tRNA pseudouridine(55) synthase TruB [Candidatus Clavichlamydia salmonicola]
MQIVTELKEGLLLVDKPQGRTSFSLIRRLTRLLGVKKIGHAGTLDPFATGVMVILVGRNYTRLSDKLLFQDKEYLAFVSLGATTDSYDCDGKIVGRSKKIPTLSEIESVITHFQGEIQQIPPMFSAKKVNGKKLYEYARKGQTIERAPCTIKVTSELLSYDYPEISIRVSCSKGTYIRSIAHEMGLLLGCGAYLRNLQRSRSGQFLLSECLDGKLLEDNDFNVLPYLRCFSENDIATTN